MDNAFARPTGEVLSHFSVTEAKGLSAAQVEQMRTKYGSNGMYELTILELH